MIARVIVACAFAVAISSAALAGDCIRDSYGKVVCGIGYCAADEMGRVKCSTKPGGGALIDSNGRVQCAGGCQDGSAQFCEEAVAPRDTSGAR
jgi:hypothetical protein